MSVAVVPNTFVTGRALDAEEINQNMRAIARDIQRSLDRRYMYSSAVFDVGGMAAADTAAQRSILLQQPAISGSTTSPVEICGIEMRGMASSTGTDTFTLSSSDTSWPPLVCTGDEHAQSNISQALPSAGLTLTLVPTATTLTGACIVVHFRADRGAQGNSVNHSPWVPEFLGVGDTFSGATLDTELTNAAAAVTRDTTNNQDIRCVSFMTRNLATAMTLSLPSGAGQTGAKFHGCMVAGGGVTCSIVSGSGSMTLTGTGLSNTVTDIASQSSKSDDPTDSTDDTTVVITPSANVELVYILMWWQ